MVSPRKAGLSVLEETELKAGEGACQGLVLLSVAAGAELPQNCKQCGRSMALPSVVHQVAVASGSMQERNGAAAVQGSLP